MKIFDQYQQTKAAVDILTAELAELKPKLIEELKANEGKVKTKTATFSLRSTKVYEFSTNFYKFEKKGKNVIANHKSYIKTAEIGIKHMKDKEIKEEVATIKSESFTPVMRVIKDKTELSVPAVIQDEEIAPDVNQARDRLEGDRDY